MKDKNDDDFNNQFDEENNEENVEELYFRHGKPILLKDLIWEIIQEIERKMEDAANKTFKNLQSHMESDSFKSIANYISKLNDDKS